MKAGMRFDPVLHGRGFVSGVVINDEMEIETGGGLLVDQLEKAQELAMSIGAACKSQWSSFRRLSRVPLGIDQRRIIAISFRAIDPLGNRPSLQVIVLDRLQPLHTHVAA